MIEKEIKKRNKELIQKMQQRRLRAIILQGAMHTGPAVSKK